MSGGGSKVTVGYWYRLGWHLILCHADEGNVEVLRVEYADRTAWSGTVSSNTEVNINQPNLLGGDKREGGWVGALKFLMGGATQTVDPYLAYWTNRPLISSYSAFDSLGGVTGWLATVTGTQYNEKLVADGGVPVPAYRGVVSLLFKSFTYAAMNPYFKSLAVLLRRIPKGLSSTYATITLDGVQHANGAHILYDVLTNKAWGCGGDASDIDIASYNAAAQTLYNEGFGLSMLWASEASAEDFVNLVCQHIGAAHFPDPSTGQYTLKLIRGGYDTSTLFVLDPSNILTLTSFQRAAPNDLVNEVTLKYTDPKTFETASVTVQNLASIKSLGKVVPRTIDMPGICNADLAARVAMRELVALSTPLAKVTLDVNLTAWNVRPGDVVKFSWPKRDIAQLLMRVTDIEIGDLRSGRVQITAVEDQFGLASASYVTRVPSAWAELPQGLSDISAYLITELPYFVIINVQGEDYASYLSDNRNFIGVLAARSNGLWTGYDVQENVSGTYTSRGIGVFPSWVTMTNAITQQPTDTVWSYNAFFDPEDIVVGDLGVIDNEWVQVSAINTAAQTITVERGVLDTIPATHAVGARLWVFGSEGFQDYSVQRLSGETVTYKLLPQTGSDSLPVTSATARSLTLAGRQERPYPPGNVQLNGAYFPDQVTDDIVMTWAHRDRTVQTADPIPWSSGSVTSEGSVTYTAQYYRSTDNTLLHSQTGITAATKTVTEAEIGQETGLKVVLSSVKGSVSSWQSFTHTFTRTLTTDPYSLRVLADSPLVFYRLSDVMGSTQAKDVSDNARNATATSVTFGSAALPVPSSLNKAAAFNGSTSFVELAYTAALAPTAALTLELWVQFNAFPTGSNVTSLISKTQTGGYNIQLDAATGRLEFLVRRNGAYGSAGFLWASYLTTGVPYHIVATFDGRYARIYLDGVLIATDDAGASYALQYSVNNSLIVGGEATATTGKDATYPVLNGSLDEVSVYGSAVAASEVQARYMVGLNRYTYREDMFWDKTVLLLHMNGAHASTSFTDVKGHAMTAVGNAQHSVAHSKFGSTSAAFDGSGDAVTTTGTTDFNIFGGDFTIEFFAYFVSSAGNQCLLELGLDASNRANISLVGNINFYLLAAGTGAQRITATAPSNNAWHHIALTQRGTTVRLFVDGAIVGSWDRTAAISGALSLSIGRSTIANGSDFNGYLDEVRITKACRYTRAFDVPIEAFPEQSVVAQTVDPFWASTRAYEASLLLNFEGANGSTTFTDSAVGTPVTAGGNAQISTARFKYGSASGLFDGAGDSLNIPGGDNFDFAAGDFTIEAWIYPTSVTGPANIINKRQNNSTYAPFTIFIEAGAFRLACSLTGSSWSIDATAGTIVANAWHHVAVTRSGTVFRMFVNGALVYTSSAISGALTTNATPVTIGTLGDGTTQPFAGNIDDLRIIKGAALYTATFTPPAAQLTTPVTAVVERATVLLLHCNGTNGSTTFTDQKGKTITANGNAQISTAQSKFGGASGLFDGSGDYLALAASADFQFGTGDFTVEGWVRPAAVGDQAIIGLSGTGSDTYYGVRIGLTTAGKWLVSCASGTSAWIDTTPAGTYSANQWHHFALTRKGSTFTFFVNGASVRSYSSAAALFGTGASHIGAITLSGSLGQFLNGYLDDVRVTKGVARYTSDFAVPKLPYPDA